MNIAINSYHSLEDELKKAIEDVPDFPQAGVVFKDLGPVWVDPNLRAKAVSAVAEWIQSTGSTLKAINGTASSSALVDRSGAQPLGPLVFGEFEYFKWQRATAGEVPRGTLPFPSIGVA